MDFDATGDEESKCQALALGFEFVACMDFCYSFVLSVIFSTLAALRIRKDQIMHGF